MTVLVRTIGHTGMKCRIEQCEKHRRLEVAFTMIVWFRLQLQSLEISIIGKNGQFR